MCCATTLECLWLQSTVCVTAGAVNYNMVCAVKALVVGVLCWTGVCVPDWCGVGEAIYCALKYSELYSIFYTQYTYHRVGNIHKGIGIGVLPLLDLF